MIDCREMVINKESFIKTIKQFIRYAIDKKMIVKYNAIAVDFYITEYDKIERFELLYDLFMSRKRGLEVIKEETEK